MALSRWIWRMPRSWLLSWWRWSRLPRKPLDTGSVPWSDRYQAAAKRLDITGSLAKVTSGYGLSKAQPGTAWFGRLQAHLLLIDDGTGGEGGTSPRTLFVCLDGPAGSRFLTEALAHEVSCLGLTVDRIVLAATHTHSAPGSYWAVPFYDVMTGAGGFDAELAHGLVRQLADATRELAGQLVDAEVVLGESRLDGHLWNRSMQAFVANEREPTEVDAEARRAMAEAFSTAHHGGAPSPSPHDTAARMAVDPRFRALVWRRAGGGQPLAVLGSVNGTPALMPDHVATYGSDVVGVARRTMQEVAPVPTLLFGGVNGDVNVVDAGRSVADLVAAREAWVDHDPPWWWPFGPDKRPLGVCRERCMAATVQAGRALGRAASAAVKAALAQPGGCTDPVVVRFEQTHAPGATVELDPAFDDVPAPVTTRLPEHWALGESTMSASELNRSRRKPPWLSFRERSYRAREAGEAIYRRVGPHAPGHDPKRAPDTRIPLWLAEWLALLVIQFPTSFSPYVPLRLIDVGLARLVAVPVEPSVQLAAQAEAALQQAVAEREPDEPGAPADAPVLWVAMCGEYVGYANTRREYSVQDYEGSSSYWGRDFGPYLRHRLATLARRPPSAPPAGFAGFLPYHGAFLPGSVHRLRGLVRQAPRRLTLAGHVRHTAAHPITSSFAADQLPDGTWRLSAHVVPAKPFTREQAMRLDDGAVVRFVRPDGSGGWVAATTAAGVPLDDVHADVMVAWHDRRWNVLALLQPEALGAQDPSTWSVEFLHRDVLPSGASAPPWRHPTP